MDFGRTYKKSYYFYVEYSSMLWCTGNMYFRLKTILFIYRIIRLGRESVSKLTTQYLTISHFLKYCKHSFWNSPDLYFTQSDNLGRKKIT